MTLFLQRVLPALRQLERSAQGGLLGGGVGQRVPYHGEPRAQFLGRRVAEARQRQSVLAKREVSLSELPENALYDVGAEDVNLERAEAERRIFHVRGIDIPVSDQQLAKALSCLLPRNREIILLAYFAELTDEEVAQKLKLSRSTVQRRRTSALDKLREMLGHDE